MSSITEIEKAKLESLLGTGSGNVLNFTNATFQTFLHRTVGIDIYDDRYSRYGQSKGKRLTAFYDLDGDNSVGKLIEALLKFYKASLETEKKLETLDGDLHADCMNAAFRLQGKKVKPKNVDATAEDFLRHDIDEIPISRLNIESAIAAILEQRRTEVDLCLTARVPLSAIIMCGSILEGLLLGLAQKNMVAFNLAPSSPRHPDGTVKKLNDWTLAQFIDVAHSLGYLGLDVKKFGHVLRDFRNYIHPYAQLSQSFNPDMNTAKISWQVLKAAIHDIHEKTK